MSKGDRPRPKSVSLTEFDSNFDTIFGKKTMKNALPKEIEDAQVEDEAFDQIEKSQVKDSTQGG